MAACCGSSSGGRGRRARSRRRGAALRHGGRLVGGLPGSTRRNARGRHESPHPDTQLNIMNARAIALVAEVDDRWPLAGDQLYGGSGFDRRESSDGHAAGHRLGGDRSDSGTAHRVPQIFGALRRRRDQIRELEGRQAPAPARHQCESGAIGHDPRRRPGNQVLGDFPDRSVAGGCDASRLEPQDRPARVDGPPRRFVAASDAVHGSMRFFSKCRYFLTGPEVRRRVVQYPPVMLLPNRRKHPCPRFPQWIQRDSPVE